MLCRLFLSIVVVIPYLCDVKAQLLCPSNYSDHPLILISMDGFRYDYLERNLTPNINSFLATGVSAPYMKATYPTLTFPNHYTIATGLYPESHGIVGNDFYAPEFNESFFLGDPETLDGKWWGGDPIWNTVVKQGKLSATYFWPGSDATIEGMHPTYWYPYDGSVPYEERVNQVLDWLTYPVETRPSWICVYFDEPDHTGHSFGPDSPEENSILVEMDLLFKSLIDGISDLGLTSCVNIILLSDHGMAPSGNYSLIQLDNIVPNIETEAYVWEGSHPRLNVYKDYQNSTEEIRNNYTCQMPELRQYDSAGMPTRQHYSNNDRIGDVVFHLDEGYVGIVGSGYYLEGQHGYDNYYSVMQPIFIANGPDFKSGVVVEPFQNIEVYNIMCTLVGVNPAPNNGTVGALYDLLKNPPDYPNSLTETFNTAVFPTATELPSRLNISGCSGDSGSPENWIYSLNMTEEAMNSSLEFHLPWGVPLTGSLPADLLLLFQEDHVTGYSQALKMPLWTSFTVNSSRSGSPVSDWSSDVRLTSVNTPTCQSYEDLLQYGITMEPLFPRSFTEDFTSPNIPYLVSNAVPMTAELRQRWLSLVDGLVWSWFGDTAGPLNIVVGPLFDNNADSLVDDFASFTNSPEVPSALFLIATRCLDAVTDLANCASTRLDDISFIYPETNPVPNCLNATQYALMFSARVKDVEIATGLTFYPSLSYEDRMRLEIRIHSSLWNTP